MIASEVEMLVARGVKDWSNKGSYVNCFVAKTKKALGLNSRKTQRTPGGGAADQHPGARAKD